jgi:hypothetical protein
MAGFDAARRAALVTDLLALVARRPADLLPFEAVREGLQLRHLVDRGIQQVPLVQIVGSLDRAGEFNRFFLPRDEALRGRWEEIRELAESPRGFPPVELYKVGQVYFVVDGHHRVSVAHSLEAPSIEAHVLEFLTPVSLEPGVSLEDVLLRRGLAEFLELTGLAAEPPDDYRVTVADGYRRLIEHIRVHGYYKGVETGRDIPWQEEVASWRDTVYRPMIETIRRSGILEEFPGRTRTDLYLFVMDHLHHLRQLYQNPQLQPDAALEDFEKIPNPEKKRGLSTWLGGKRRRKKKSPG